MHQSITSLSHELTIAHYFCSLSDNVPTTKAEAELRRTQDEFDKQVELVTEICNKIIKSNEQHVKYLSKFVDAQADFYQQQKNHLDDLLNNRTGKDDANNSHSNNSTGFATFAALSETPNPAAGTE